MKKRSYKITFDLREGYDEQNTMHSLADAAGIIGLWMETRNLAAAPIVTGMLQSGTLFYPSRGGNNPTGITAVASAIFAGELSGPGSRKRKNKEVKKTLESLAQALKTGLKQQTVYIIYRDRNWSI